MSSLQESLNHQEYDRLKDSDEYGEYTAKTFDEKVYDVACILPKTLCCVSATLYLHPNEAEFKNDCCYGFSQVNRRVPYGELAGIEKEKCCWFSAFKAGTLTSKSSHGEEVPFCPGTGFEDEYVNEIVEELKLRQYHRGDAAKMRILEKQIRDISRVEGKLDAIMDHLGLSSESTPVAVKVSDMSR